MDSMRSLNTSLPTTRRSKQQVSQEVLQAFKQAALSVTNLYKTAASDQSRAHSEGYQDALEDLLGFLDKENLGLDDGEGWKVRQWATERLQGQAPANAGSDDEDGEEEKRARSSSPTLQRKNSQEALRSEPAKRSSSPARADSAPPTQQPEQASASKHDTILPSGDFSFRSSHAYPTVHDIDMDSTDNSSSPINPTTSAPSMRVELIPRQTRQSTRHDRHIQRTNSRSSTTPQSTSLGPGAGSKRRQPFNEFFDINFFGGNGKDGFGGFGGASKRSRNN